MIYLMMRQKAPSGKKSELEKASAQGVRIWKRHGAQVVGFWSNWIGGDIDETIYVYGFKDFPEYQEIDIKVHNDPDWPKFQSAIRECSIGRSTELLRPVAY